MTHLARNLPSLPTPFPTGRKTFASWEIVFSISFWIYSQNQKKQSLRTTGKQLYPLFLLQGLTSTFTEAALASPCKLLVSLSIRKIQKRLCLSPSKSFPLNTGTKLASSSFAWVIQHSKKCATNETGFSCEALSFCSSKAKNYLSRLLKISGVKRASCPYALCCSSWETLSTFFESKRERASPWKSFWDLLQSLQPWCPASWAERGVESLQRGPSVGMLSVGGIADSWE